MDNLIFSLNATLPVFLMMVLGIVLKKIGWVSESFASQMNKFVFLVPLPLLLFQDLATVDFEKAWKGLGGEKSVLGGIEALRACG